MRRQQGCGFNRAFVKAICTWSCAARCLRDPVAQPKTTFTKILRDILNVWLAAANRRIQGPDESDESDDGDDDDDDDNDNEKSGDSRAF